MQYFRTPILPTPHNLRPLLPRRPAHILVPRLIFLILPISHRTRGDRAKLEGMVDMRVLAGDLSHCQVGSTGGIVGGAGVGATHA